MISTHTKQKTCKYIFLYILPFFKHKTEFKTVIQARLFFIHIAFIKVVYIYIYIYIYGKFIFMCINWLHFLQFKFHLFYVKCLIHWLTVLCIYKIYF